MLSDNVLFTNLVEVEERGMSGTGESTTGGSDENVQLAYRPLCEIQKVREWFSLVSTKCGNINFALIFCGVTVCYSF